MRTTPRSCSRSPPPGQRLLGSSGGEVVWLQGFDETRWRDPRLPTVEELDAVTDRPLAIWRADGHICLANTEAIVRAGVGDLDGAERAAGGGFTGRVRSEANDRLHRWCSQALSDREVQDLQLRAAGLAASRGVTSVHEMSMPAGAGLRDLEVFLAHRDTPAGRRRADRRHDGRPADHGPPAAVDRRRPAGRRLDRRAYGRPARALRRRLRRRPGRLRRRGPGGVLPERAHGGAPGGRARDRGPGDRTGAVGLGAGLRARWIRAAAATSAPGATGSSTSRW